RAMPHIKEPILILLRKCRHIWRIQNQNQNPLVYPDGILYERYRFSSDGIQHLCHLLGSDVSNATHLSNALTVEQTVCLGLRYLATGHFMYSIGDAEHLSKNTICRAVRRVVLALSKLLDAFIVLCNAIKELFASQVIVVQIFVIADIVNRKSFHSINIQMTCDHHLTVTSLETQWPGSVHDSQILRESSLGQRFEQGDFDGLLVGDRGYLCLPYLMTPYSGPQTAEQRKYNKASVRIEITFGGLQVRPQRAYKVVAACVVLHNIAIIRKERAPCQLPMPPDIVDPITLDHPTGRAVREAITQKFFQ
uniref:DDE Tnp4 domain-containing protein n=1 Tax=Lates calcarifer TaxID=8187 RepID=A0A4W6FZ50_LATCA